MKIFLTAFLQVFLGSANMYFIYKMNYYGIGITGFFMSLLWTFNVKKIAFSKPTHRLIYAIGAMIGSLAGVYISKLIMP